MIHYSPTGDGKDVHDDHPPISTFPKKVSKNISEVDCPDCIDILKAMGEYPGEPPADAEYTEKPVKRGCPIF